MCRILTRFTLAIVVLWAGAAAAESAEPTTASGWQQPPDDILEVLHAPPLPWSSIAPGEGHLLLADPVLYPPLAELAAPMHKLAGIRVNPALNGFHGRHGGTSPRLVRVDTGEITALDLPAGAEVHDVAWTADGRRFALTVGHGDHLGLWVGSVEGSVRKIEDVALNPLLGDPVTWAPDQERLLIRRVPPGRGPAPAAPAIPAGPQIAEGEGGTARSTYEARNLLQTAHDDALFEHFVTSELALVDPRRRARTGSGGGRRPGGTGGPASSAARRVDPSSRTIGAECGFWVSRGVPSGASSPRRRNTSWWGGRTPTHRREWRW